MQIFHIALASEWAAAQRSGFYVTSTLGRTLTDEGFIHASRADQWEATRERFYADVTEPMVLLVIDTELLTSPWREDPVGADTFPHIYGPLTPGAVVSVVPLTPTAPMPTAATPAAATPAAPVPAVGQRAARPTPTPGEFRRAVAGEVAFRTSMALLLMALTAAGLLLVRHWWGRDWAWLGAAVGFVLGVIAVVLAGRARARRIGR